MNTKSHRIFFIAVLIFSDPFNEVQVIQETEQNFGVHVIVNLDACYNSIKKEQKFFNRYFILNDSI